MDKIDKNYTNVNNISKTEVSNPVQLVSEGSNTTNVNNFILPTICKYKNSNRINQNFETNKIGSKIKFNVAEVGCVPLIEVLSIDDFKKATVCFLYSFHKWFFIACIKQKALRISQICNFEIKEAKDFVHLEKLKGCKVQDLYSCTPYTNFSYEKSWDLNWYYPEVRVDSQTLPDLGLISFLKPEKQSIQWLNNQELKESQKLYSFMDPLVVSKLMKGLDTLWHRLDEFTKQSFWFYITGFCEPFLPLKVQQLQLVKNELTKKTTLIAEYLKKEIAMKRIIYLGSDSVYKSYISSKIITITEIKDNNLKKYRHVYNNLNANEAIQSVGENFSLTTPNIETLFTNNQIYERMKKTIKASVYDKKDFFRQFPMSYKNLFMSMIVVEEEHGLEYYVDLRGRMGSIHSSIFAQRVSNASDAVFNIGHGREGEFGWSLTNQDDSLVLLANKDTHSHYMEVTEMLGLELNKRKTQREQEEVQWCGYVINFRDKTVKLTLKRLNKIKDLQKLLNNAYKASRRDFARFMGTVYSARVICLANGFHQSPLMYFLRKYTFLFADYYTDKQLLNEFYDYEVTINSLMLAEVNFAVHLVSQTANFKDIRRGLGLQLSLGMEVSCVTSKDFMVTDASDEALGVGIFLNGKDYSFRLGFGSLRTSKWSINVKETYAVMWGLMALWALGVNERDVTDNSRYDFPVFVDNNTCLSLCATRKVSLKSVELGLISKLIQAWELTMNKLNFIFRRVPTNLNGWSDRLSRDRELAMDLDWDYNEMDPLVSLLIGVSSKKSQNPSSKILESLMRYGLQEPNSEKIVGRL